MIEVNWMTSARCQREKFTCSEAEFWKGANRSVLSLISINAGCIEAHDSSIWDFDAPRTLDELRVPGVRGNGKCEADFAARRNPVRRKRKDFEGRANDDKNRTCRPQGAPRS